MHAGEFVFGCFRSVFYLIVGAVQITVYENPGLEL